MTLFLQLLSSFITGLGFGIIVNVPKRVLVHCGITGMVGWLIQTLMTRLGYGFVSAIFFGAVGVAVCSIIFARRLKMPATTFNLPGIFPLVPGIAAYQSLQSIMSGNYTKGIELLIRTFTLSVTIAFAIVLIELLYATAMRLLKNRKVKKETPNHIQ